MTRSGEATNELWTSGTENYANAVNCSVSGHR